MFSLSSSPPKHSPYPPFASWPVQHTIPAGFAWLTPHGPAIVTQMVEPVATSEAVDGLHDFLDALARAQIPQRMPGLSIVHDWRVIERVEPSASRRFQERMSRPGKPFSHVQSFVITSRSPLARMAMRTTALAHQALTGQKAVRFLDDAVALVRELDLAPPPPLFLKTSLAAAGAR